MLTFVAPPKLRSSKKWRQTNNSNIPVKSIWSPKDIRGNQKHVKKAYVKGPKNHQLGECKFCGRKHEQRRGNCPAYGQTCSSCGKPYHLVVKCESTTSDSKRPPQKSKRRKVHQLADSDDASCSSEEETLSVSTENAANSVEMTDYKSKIFAHMEVAGALVKMQVDSGGSCNVLS